MKIGYARVSMQDQNLDLQKDALTAAGCERMFLEKVSGGKKDRIELRKMFDQLRPGDVVVVWRLDRLGRSTRDNIDLVLELKEKQCGIIFLTENIDTTTTGGMLIFTIFSALAEAERQSIVERTKAGLTAARSRGRVGGRPSGLTKENQDKAELVANLYKNDNSIKKIKKLTGIGSNKTIYKYLRYMGIAISDEEKQIAANRERPALELDGNYKSVR
jgi:DNA invertase Pin-like site-specific DNA recombinase